MSDITLRLVKQSPLTNQELDNNFANLNADKYQAGDAAQLQSVQLSGMVSGMEWNGAEGAVDVPLSSDVTLQLGQEFVFYAKATEAITNGDVVMFAGAQGGHLLIKKCDMSAPNFDPSHVVGLATQDLTNNEFGYITSIGRVRDLDTSEYPEGTILYADPDTIGAVSTEIPTPPNHIIQVGAVVKSHANNGIILTRITHSPDSDEVPEGSNNLYFSALRAVTAIKADDSYNNTQWDQAYSWGDHAGLYLPIGADTLPNQVGYGGKFLTTDGATASWATVDTTNGDTAFTWGDHALAGYATTAYVDGEVVTLNNTITALGDSISGLVQEATDQAVIATAQAVIATDKAEEAQGHVNTASDHEDQTKIWRDDTKEWRDEVADKYELVKDVDAVQIAADAEQVAQDKVAVSSDAEQVALDRIAVNNDKVAAEAAAAVYTDVQTSLVTMASNIISTQAIVVEHHAFA